MTSFKFPKKLPKEWIEAIERNGRVGSKIHSLKVVAKDKRGIIIKTGKDSFKILHDGKNTENFGYETEGDSHKGTGNDIFGSWFTCPEAGTADSITAYIYIWSSSDKIKCAIYKRSDDSLVGVTQEKTGVTGLAWYNFAFSAPKPDLENIDYYLVTWSEISGGEYEDWFYYHAEEGKGVSEIEAYNSFPDYLTPIPETTKFSIYCTYTPSAPTYVYQKICHAFGVQSYISLLLSSTYNLKSFIIKLLFSAHRIGVSIISNYSENLNIGFLVDYVRKKLSSLFKITGLVYKPIVLQLSILKRIFQYLTFNFNIFSYRIKTLNLVYNIRNLITQIISLVHSIEAIIYRSLKGTYHLMNYRIKEFVLAHSLRKLIINSLNILYSLTQRIYQFLSMKYNLRFLITKTLSFTYELVSKLHKSLMMIYSSLEFRRKVLVLQHSLKTYVIGIISKVYSLKEFVFGKAVVVYNIKSFISKILKILYDISTTVQVEKLINLMYSTTSLVRKQLVITFDSIARVFRNLKTIYHVMGLRISSIGINFGLRVNIIKVLNLLSSIIEKIYAQTLLRYSIKEYKEVFIAIAYGLKNLVVSSLRSIYSSIGRIFQVLKIGYRIGLIVEKILVSVYGIISRLQKSLTLINNIRNYIISSVSSLYQLMSYRVTLLKIKSSLSGILSKTIEISYSLIGYIKRILTAKYSIRNLITKLVSLQYGLRERIIKSLRALYNLSVLVSLELSILYGILSYRIKILTIQWNIIARIKQVLTLTYGIIRRISRVLTITYRVGFAAIESVLTFGYRAWEVFIVAIYRLQRISPKYLLKAFTTTTRIKLATLKYRIKKYIKRREI